MSVEASSWAWKQKIKAGMKLVLLAIADHADATGICYPGQNGLSEKTGLDRATVNQHIKSLAELGLIEIRHRASEKGYRSSNLYILDLSKVVNSKIGKSKVGLSKVGISASKVGFSGSKVGNPNSIESSEESSEEPSVKEAASRPSQATAQPEPDPVWTDGVRWLESKGCKNIRPYLGKLCKDYGSDAVVLAIDQARTQNPVEPKSYLLEILKSPKRRRTGVDDPSLPNWLRGAI